MRDDAPHLSARALLCLLNNRLAAPRVWIYRLDMMSISEARLGTGRQSDRAYAELKRLIVETELAPGVLLEERDLMERLGVGRTPLREAIQRLTRDNLIESVPHRGYFVTEVTFANVRHAFELRLAIEVFAAGIAARRATARDLQQFDDLLAEIRAGLGTGDRHWHLDVDRRVHLVVASATGNPYLRQTIEDLFNLSARLQYMARQPISLAREEIDNYQHLRDAIGARDDTAAAAAMQDHIGTSPFLTGVGLDGVDS
jgi:DNA-binding GntR family transcriptional regulator